MMQKSFVARSVQAALTVAVLAATPTIASAQESASDEQVEQAQERIQVTAQEFHNLPTWSAPARFRKSPQRSSSFPARCAPKT